METMSVVDMQREICWELGMRSAPEQSTVGQLALKPRKDKCYVAICTKHYYKSET